MAWNAPSGVAPTWGQTFAVTLLVPVVTALAAHGVGCAVGRLLVTPAFNGPNVYTFAVGYATLVCAALACAVPACACMSARSALASVM